MALYHYLFSCPLNIKSINKVYVQYCEILFDEKIGLLDHQVTIVSNISYLRL